jgi:hypothetical protein
MRLPLLAAVFSFIYHLALAIAASYVPLDHADATAATVWVYSWTACIVAYFGVLAVFSVS